MAHVRILLLITLAVLAGCSDSKRPQVQVRPEKQVAAPKSVQLDSDQQLLFRLVSPLEYEIDYPDFYVLETEVTNAQFKVYLDATGATKTDTDVLDIIKHRKKHGILTTADVPYKIEDESTIWRDGTYPDGLQDHPIALVTLDDATGFAKWLNETHGESGVFRLPTWNEWMIAAYGKSRNYPWGNKWDRRNLHSSHGYEIAFESLPDVEEKAKPPQRTEPVKSRPNGRTPERVFGMLGNVGEYIIEGDPISDSYFNLGSRSMGGGFTDGLSLVTNENARLPPREDYWGYSHYSFPRECDLGFRLVYAPNMNTEMLKRARLFKQNDPAWMIKSDDDAEASLKKEK